LTALAPPFFGAGELSGATFPPVCYKMPILTLVSILENVEPPISPILRGICRRPTLPLAIPIHAHALSPLRQNQFTIVGFFPGHHAMPGVGGHFYATLARGLDLGINHLETAQGYGASEFWLGNFLRHQGSTDTLVITTKVPPQPDAATMAKRIDQSLERLQVSRLDCLAIHGINTWDHLQWVQRPGGCMTAIQQAMQDGRVGHVGFSTHGSRELIAATIHTGLFEFVNLHYYFFYQRHQPIIDLARHQDMGIFIISPGDKGGLLYTPPAKLQQLCAPYSPLALTYRWLLADPHITTLSCGPAQGRGTRGYRSSG
jgi:diketogulonate reductase-like aldo/keto reductase